MQEQATFESKDELRRLVELGKGLGFYILLAGSEATMGFSADDWVQVIKKQQTGFVLGSGQSDIVRLNAPMTPASQGYFVRRNRSWRIKVAAPFEGMRSGDWSRYIRERHSDG